MRALRILLLSALVAAPAAAGKRDSHIHAHPAPTFTYRYLVLPLQGQFTADRANIVKFTPVQDIFLVGVQFSARVSTDAVTANVLVDNVSILRSVVDVGTPADGAITYAEFNHPDKLRGTKVKSGSAITVNLTVATDLDDLTVTFIYRSLVGDER